VPLALLGYVIGWWRPAPWTWPILAAVLVWPATSAIVIVGGTTMWAAALTAGGLRWGWPSALILLKPSFLPLAAIGIRRRSWWITVGVLGLVSLAMLPLWGEYLTALGNATDVKPWYSLGDLPLVLAPLVAYAGRRTSPDLVTIVPDESGVSTDAEDTHSTPTPTPTPTSASA
jgi:hypothetical protein